jgi:hypothetical protein
MITQTENMPNTTAPSSLLAFDSPCDIPKKILVSGGPLIVCGVPVNRRALVKAIQTERGAKSHVKRFEVIDRHERKEVGFKFSQQAHAWAHLALRVEFTSGAKMILFGTDPDAAEKAKAIKAAKAARTKRKKKGLPEIIVVGESSAGENVIEHDETNRSIYFRNGHGIDLNIQETTRNNTNGEPVRVIRIQSFKLGRNLDPSILKMTFTTVDDALEFGSRLIIDPLTKRE